MLMFRSPDAEAILSANKYEVLYRKVLMWGMKENVFTDEDRNAYLGAWSQPGALTGGLNYYRAAQVGPPSGKEDGGKERAAGDRFAKAIQTPTLVIWGEKDTALLPGNLLDLERYVARLTIKRIPDGSHWVVHEKPDLVNAYIRAFIEER
jgi:pimeloyl-ACP methyl ester carboxylesterase